MTIDSLRIVLNSLHSKGLLVGSLSPDLALWALSQAIDRGEAPELSSLLPSSEVSSHE